MAVNEPFAWRCAAIPTLGCRSPSIHGFQAAYAATQPNYEAQRDCFFWAYVEYAFFCAMLLDAPKGRRVGRALMPDKPQQI